MDREKIITFIRSNDKSYEKVNFFGYNINQLVMIKIRIEIEIHKELKKQKNNP